jgi:hypothetical protein
VVVQGGAEEDLPFTVELVGTLQQLEEAATAATNGKASELFCANDNFIRCCRTVEGKGKSRCANCISVASPTFIALSRLHLYACMALLHAAGIRLMRVVCITSTDPRPLTLVLPNERLHEAARAFISSSVEVGKLHGPLQCQVPHLERTVAHPGRLYKLQDAFRGQEVACRALLDLAAALAPTAAASTPPLQLLRLIQKSFARGHWLHKQLYLDWLHKEDTWAGVSTASCDVRFGMASPPLRDPVEAQEVVMRELLLPVARWAVEQGMDEADAYRWLALLTYRGAFTAEISQAMEEVRQGLERHRAEGSEEHPGLMPSSYSMPNVEVAGGGVLPFAAHIETFPRAETCLHAEEGEEGEGPQEPPSIFQRHELEGELSASLTSAGPAELVAMGDGLSAPPRHVLDLEAVERCYAARLVVNACDINDGRSTTSNGLACPSVEMWNERLCSLGRNVIGLQAFSVAFPIVVLPGQPPASKRGEEARLSMLQTIERVCTEVKIHDLTGERRRCSSQLNGGATSSSLRLTAVLIPGCLPLLVLHGLPQGSAEGSALIDGSKGAAIKALPPQLLQSRYRKPELDEANILRALRCLGSISLHDLPDRQRALDPASVLQRALASRGGARGGA